MDILSTIMSWVAGNAGYILLGCSILCILLLVLVLVLFRKNRQLRNRMEVFTEGANGVSLEDALKRVVEDNKRVKTQTKNSVDEIVRLNENMLTAFRKIGIVKFNAFPGMAGKMSSSVAFLNNENNGVIISTLHGQEGCYTYVKEIMNGKSVNPLTPEDEEALKSAMQMQV